MRWTYPEIYVLRHGQTEWNAEGRFQGRLNSPLTAKGRQNALDQGRILAGLDFTQIDVISSPQGRAFQTAALAFSDRVDMIRTDDRLMEIGVGEWSGMAKEDLPHYPNDNENISGALDLYEKAPGGEGFARLQARCESFLSDLKRPAILVTHGITSRMLRVLHMGQGIGALGDVPGGQGIVYHMKDGAHHRLDGPVPR